MASRQPSLCTRIRPSPPATLFPYTTLFRSIPIQINSRSHESTDRNSIIVKLTRMPAGATSPASGVRKGRFASGLVFRRDRKSTRLNSSHTVISYAVFCLKKEKGGKLEDNEQ